MGGATTDSPNGSPPALEGLRRPLTARQGQILALVADGFSDKEIAAQLDVSLATVRSHLQRLYREHGFRNRADAAAGWVTHRRDLQARPAPEIVAQPAASSPSGTVAGPLPGRSRRWLPALAAAVALLAGVTVLTRPTLLQTLGGREAAGLRAGGTSTQASLPGGGIQAAAAGSSPSARAASSAPTTARPPQSASAAAPAAAARPATSGATSSSAGHAVAPPAPPAPPAIQTQLASQQLSLINQDRASASNALLQLPPVQWNSCLATAATEVAQGLAARGYLGATRGVTLDLSCGVGAAPAETTAYWSTISDAQLNAIFMNDPAERARILGPYHAIGAAWARTPNGVAFLVVEFA